MSLKKKLGEKLRKSKRKLRGPWKRLRNIFSAERKERLIIREVQRERRSRQHEECLKKIHSFAIKWEIPLSIKQRVFLASLDANALFNIYFELLGIKSHKSWALEACLDFFKKIRKGETPNPARKGGKTVLNRYDPGDNPLRKHIEEYIQAKEKSG